MKHPSKIKSNTPKTNQSFVFFLSVLVSRSVCRTCLGMLIGLSFGCNFAAQQHNTSGKQYYEMGQFSTAAAEFQRALKANPRNADAYYNLGATYYAVAKQHRNEQWTKQAEQLFRQSIALNDRHTEAHRSLAALLVESGQGKYAFDLLNTWRSRYPNSTDPNIELARLSHEFGDNRRATDYLADALRIDGNDVRALKAMGRLREQQGEVQLALQNYYRVLQLDNRQADVSQAVQRIQTYLAQANPGGYLPPTPGQPRYGLTTPYQAR